MRIAHVLASYEVGGAECIALSLAGRQRAKGHEVLALALAVPDGPMVPRFRAAGVPAHCIRKGAGLDWTLPPRLLTFFLRERIQVVHTHNPQGLIYAALPTRLAGLRLVHTKHGEAVETGRRMWLRRQASRLADAVVSVSRQTDEHARHMGEGHGSKLHVIENGVDLSRFRPDREGCSAVRAELGVPPGARLVGTAGRLEEVKNQALLLRAAAPLLGSNLRLVLVGDGPLRASLQALVRELGRDAEVRFLGTRSDMPRVMAALDLFVLSSHTEGLPVVLLEAMATGLPVVCTAVGGIAEVVEDGRTGLLVREGDEVRLRESMARLLGDPALAMRMGEDGRARAVERYSVDRMVARYEELYVACRGDLRRDAS
jgi:glycosyltransferase involved in cell wall biosynthesis